MKKLSFYIRGTFDGREALQRQDPSFAPVHVLSAHAAPDRGSIAPGLLDHLFDWLAVPASEQYFAHLEVMMVNSFLIIVEKYIAKLFSMFK